MRRSQERTIGQLVAQVTEDLSVIVRTEIPLAKTELSAQVGTASKGVGMLAGAGVVALYGLGLLFITLSPSSPSGCRRGPASSSSPSCCSSSPRCSP